MIPRTIWRIFLMTAMLGVGSLAIAAQSPTAEPCPADRVCITVEQARQHLINEDTVKAQAAELGAKETAIRGLNDEVNKLKIELARVMGEKTGSDQMVVRLSALLDLSLKNTKKRCAPFSILCL